MRISDWSSDVCSSDLFLIAAPGATLAETEILAACRASLARYKVPVRALVIDTLPSIASPNGVKIQRGRLREMAQRPLAGPTAATCVQAQAHTPQAEIDPKSGE